MSTQPTTTLRYTTPSDSVRGLGCLLVFSLLAVPGEVRSQDVQARTEASPDRWIIGQVLDDATGQPIPNVHFISVRTGRSVLSDLEGRFRMEQGEDLADGLRLEALGYHPGWMPPDYIEANPRMTVGLTPDPIVMEGIRVMHDRFEDRRRRVPVSTTVLGEADLWGAGSVLDVVASRAPGLMAGCGSFRGRDPCLMRRGQPLEPYYVIDEMPAPGGAQRLAMMDPSEVHMVEIYDRGAHVRVYTRWFMEWVMERNPERVVLHPVITLMQPGRTPGRTLGW